MQSLLDLGFDNSLPHYNIFRKSIDPVTCITVNIAYSFNRKDKIEDSLTASLGYKLTVLFLPNKIEKYYYKEENLIKEIKKQLNILNK